MDLDERKARLLRAVVHEFIYTEKPVGSKSLTERYSLGVSPATIRNELAVLEEQGYLSHPHTSAGRIPTDRGYRFYVDALSGVGELARAQEETIARFFEGTADLEETLQRTSLLLSSLTHYTAMVA
ncbi:MAG TPA: heat-inducible transcriptional repressor HrcA, partial [Actinomycetes bacterium]|nr:heat-inducible transcriptional repressor HrcA [Actinomycetes bacterium]